MFPDVTKHSEYLRGQSLEWCNQLAAQTGKYEFPWRTIYEGDSAEGMLSDRLTALIHGKVLDVGCGHGEYTARWADRAEELVGYDMTEGFVATAKQTVKSRNVRFVTGRTHHGLPFPDDYFDIAYTKKGPTSWYKEGNRVVRPGGTLLLFHPGDGNGEGEELGGMFPGLFAPPAKGTPILDKINERLETSGLTHMDIFILKETVWIPTPEDVFEMVCFGQSVGFREFVRDECFRQIVSQFDRHSGEQGIRTTGFYYLIQAKAS
jgi:SAM-dependent methyltransferase